MSNEFQDRLNGLAMLVVHKNILVDPEDVIDDQSKRPQKLDSIL